MNELDAKPRSAARCKGLLVILDGLGDRPSPALDGRTPLEAAETPAFDALLARGQGGQVDPLFPGMPVDTHTGVAALMGVQPRQLVRIARGPVEAIGAGLEFESGDILLRCNFATLERDGTGYLILDRRAGRIRTGTEELAASLGEMELPGGVRGLLRAGTQHRAVLRLRGESLSPRISDTDPGAGSSEERMLSCRALKPGNVRAERSAAAVNAFVERAAELLDRHPINARRVARGLRPANGILSRNAGALGRIRGLANELGLRTAVVAGEKTLHGIGRLLGYQLVRDERFTALADSDLTAKAEAAQAALRDHDLVFLHIKAPDICSHDLSPDGKREVLERIDTALASLISDPALAIAISGDHSTDSNTGRHSGDPVPTILTAPAGRQDDVVQFGERTCAHGALGRIRAAGLFVSLLEAMGALDNYHPGLAEFIRGG
jgi:2,3-bisphosphoglycerate-independent phosphoglycerate mutase